MVLISSLSAVMIATMGGYQCQNWHPDFEGVVFMMRGYTFEKEGVYF